jgi:hypothetical protein
MVADVHRERADREAARLLAARIGLAGVPVSLREPADAPGPGLGTGHWLRHAERLSAAYERAAVAVAQVPAGGVREKLDDVLDVLRRRLDRYAQIAEVGQALLPDDDTTDLDGTAPGTTPYLDGTAGQIDQRLHTASAHLTAVTAAIERIVLTDVGGSSPSEVTAVVDRLLTGVPTP